MDRQLEAKAPDIIPDQMLIGHGIYTIEVIRDEGHGPKVIQRRVVHNTVVNEGKKQIMRIAAGLNPSVFDHFRIGTSGAVPSTTDTNVKSPVASTLKTCTVITISGTRTLQLMYSYISGGGSISATGIKEVAVLNRLTTPGGSAMSRATFTAVNKTTSDKLKITYSVRIT